ncbi:hypothetical protein LCGC14_2625230 [marine sediment metagenome]|uniref:Uncharacterized protein n=1 Tax=marine sediment metagenome TaxID=412755 RepID=A0A0F9A1Z3_9ZZZZ
MSDFSNLLLRCSFGSQDTLSLSDYEKEQYCDMLWLCKLSIASFQKWFPGARFVLLYNGNDFADFVDEIEGVDLDYFYPVEYIDQHAALKEGKFQNPYHFWPSGVWWKWVPFRLDCSKHEIAIDTDIICISCPQTWYDWIENGKEILIAPDRYEKVKVNTTGDFHNHPLLQDKKPFNCGVVGQRCECNFEERFFEITRF